MAMTGGTATLVKSEKANYGQSSSSINLYVYHKEVSQNEKENNTILALGLYVTVTNSYSIGPWGDYGDSYIGTEKSGKNCKRFNGDIPNFYGTRWLVEDQEFTVPHEDDGTKTVDIYWSWGVNSPWGGYENPSGSLKIDLTTIPRVSPITATSGVIGSEMALKITKANENFTHTIEYSFGNSSGVIIENTAETSVTWTPPMELCSEIPDAETGACTIICKTYSDGELIGSSSCEVKLSVPDGVGVFPASGWINVNPYNIGTAAKDINEYVQGFSKAEITFNRDFIKTEGSYGATVASYQLTFNGETATVDASKESAYRTPVLTEAGSRNIACFVIDTRGRKLQANINITVQPYSQPTLSDVEVFRCDDKGNASDNGTYIYAKATPSYSSLNGLNTISFQARYKVRNGPYGDPIQLDSGVAVIIGGGLISADLTYLAEISVVDALGKTAIYTGYIPMDDNFFCGRRGGKGAGFGGYARRDNLLYVGWDAHIKGDLYIGEDEELVVDLPIFQRNTTTDGVFWTFRKWRSGLVECWAKDTSTPVNGCVNGEILTAFIEPPNIYVGNVHNGTKPIFIAREILYENGVYGYNLYLTDADNMACNENPGIDIYVQGRWK